MSQESGLSESLAWAQWVRSRKGLSRVAHSDERSNGALWVDTAHSDERSNGALSGDRRTRTVTDDPISMRMLHSHGRVVFCTVAVICARARSWTTRVPHANDFHTTDTRDSHTTKGSHTAKTRD